MLAWRMPASCAARLRACQAQGGQSHAFTPSTPSPCFILIHAGVQKFDVQFVFCDNGTKKHPKVGRLLLASWAFGCVLGTGSS